jgi:hypothetical protein
MMQDDDKRSLVEQVCTLIVISFCKLAVFACSTMVLAFCAGLGGATAVYLVRLYTDTLVHDFSAPGLDNSTGAIIAFLNEMLIAGFTFTNQTMNALPPM